MTESKSTWRRVAHALALITLIAGARAWRQYLNEAPGWMRTTIPAAEVKASEGFSARGRLPDGFRNLRWRRTGVRVFENGQRLPWREENPESVAKEGGGRFFIWGETLWLSGTANDNPAANGKRYELEVEKADYRWAIWAGVLMALAVTFAFAGIRRGFWEELRDDLAQPGEGRRRQLRRTQLVLAIAVGFLLTQTISPLRFIRNHIILPEMLTHSSAAEFSYAVPRWLKHHGRSESAQVYENDRPLKRVQPWEPAAKMTSGSVAYSSDAVVLRASDDSNPAINGRSYNLKVPVFPREESWRWAKFLAVLVFVVFIYTPALSAPWPAPFLLRRAKWWIGLLAIGLVKLWMIAGDEVVAAEADAAGYAMSAISLGWAGSHPAGFPIIAGLFRPFGVPWRLALECLYLLACGWVALRLFTLLRSRAIATLVFFGLAWHPWTLRAFHEFMAYPIVLLLNVALLAAMFGLLSRQSGEWKWGSFVVLGGILFFWEWSRVEDPLVYATYVLFAVVAWILSRRETNCRPRYERVAMLGLPLVMVFLLSAGVKLVNFANTGVYMKCLINSPGLLALMKALYHVKPDEQIRFAPVTRQSLQAACRVSPTLGAFESKLLDPSAAATQCGERYTKRPHEFGPYLNWLLPQALPAGLKEADAIMFRAADEVTAALREGRLPYQPASALLDPNWRLWLPDLIPCCFKSFGYATRMENWGNWPVMEGTTQERLFDVAANRRNAELQPIMMVADVSLEAAPGSIDTLAVLDRRGALMGVRNIDSNASMGNVVFHLEANVPRDAQEYGLAFFGGGKLVYADAGHDLMRWTNSLALPGSGQRLAYACEFSLSKSPNARRLEAFERAWPKVYKILFFVTLAATAIIIFLRSESEQLPFSRIVGCLVICAGLLAGRAALYGLIEANVGWEAERYMRCVGAVFVLLVFLAVTVAARWLRKAVRKI